MVSLAVAEVEYIVNTTLICLLPDVAVRVVPGINDVCVICTKRLVRAQCARINPENTPRSQNHCSSRTHDKPKRNGKNSPDSFCSCTNAENRDQISHPRHRATSCSGAGLNLLRALYI